MLDLCAHSTKASFCFNTKKGRRHPKWAKVSFLLWGEKVEGISFLLKISSLVDNSLIYLTGEL